jgi:hypothetical protein
MAAKEDAPSKKAPETRSVAFPKDVYLDGDTVVHVGPAHEHPHVITAGTATELTEKQIAAVEAALAAPEEEEDGAA